MKNDQKIKQLLEDAWTLRRGANYNEALNLVIEAEKLCYDNDYNSLGRIFHVYMQFESDHDNYSKAIELCKKSLSYYNKANNLDRIAHSTRHIADLEFQLGEYAVSNKTIELQ